MTSHPLLYGTLSNRHALVLATFSALLTFLACGYIASISPDTAPSGVTWFKAGAGAAFYMPLAINAWIDARRHVLLKNWTHLAGLIWIGSLVVIDERVPAVLSSILIGVPIFLVSKLSKGRMLGMGDARMIFILAGWNGLWAPWGGLYMLAISFFAHAVYIGLKSLTRLVPLTSRHALGPWLVAGSWLTFLLMA